MASAAARAHLEALLRTRKLDVTLTTAHGWQQAADDRVAPTGVADLDAALGGGLRRGHVSEIVGARSSGRTTLLCRTFAEATGRGEVVALVDTHDRFDPHAAAALGVDLSRLLWIRDAGDPARALKAMNLVLQAGGFGIAAFDLAEARGPDLRRFPHTTWMRLARVIEGAQTVAVLLAEEHLARSAGGVTLSLDPPARQRAGRWAGAADRSRRLQGLDIHPRVVTARRLRIKD